MRYDFDQPIDRWNTASEKWDGLETHFGVRDAIPMWVADMDFRSPTPVIEALKRRVEHGVYGYTLRPESYFQAVVDWFGRRHNWRIDPAWIVHSPGVVPALALLISTLTQPGDKIVIQPPVYHAFSRIIRAQGREIVNNPLKWENGRYTMDFADLEAKLDPSVKMLILCSPHNPVGRVWSRIELARLGRICAQHNILMVSDEIHCDLVYRPHTHIPFASVSDEFADRSITCVSPSKTFNLLGLQTASLIVPNGKLRAACKQAINRLALGSPNTFGMVACESAYRHGEEWLEQLLDYLQGNVDFLARYCKEHIPQIKVMEPEGTYLVWLDCRELGLSTEELDRFMLHKAKVAMNGGHTFGPGGEGFLRMNVACRRSLLEQSLRQIGAAVRSLGRSE